jgi:hypothetical protein
LARPLQLDILADSEVSTLLSDARSQFLPFIFRDWAESFPEFLGSLLPAVQQLPDGASAQVAYASLLAGPPVVAVTSAGVSPPGGLSGPSSSAASPGPGSPAAPTPSSGSGLSLPGLVASGPGRNAPSPALRPTASLPRAARAARASPVAPRAAVAATVPAPGAAVVAPPRAAVPPPSSQPVASQSTRVVTPPLMARPPGWTTVGHLFGFGVFGLADPPAVYVLLQEEEALRSSC